MDQWNILSTFHIVCPRLGRFTTKQTKNWYRISLCHLINFATARSDSSRIRICLIVWLSALFMYTHIRMNEHWSQTKPLNNDSIATRAILHFFFFLCVCVCMCYLAALRIQHFLYPIQICRALFVLSCEFNFSNKKKNANISEGRCFSSCIRDFSFIFFFVRVSFSFLRSLLLKLIRNAKLISRIFSAFENGNNLACTWMIVECALITSSLEKHTL